MRAWALLLLLGQAESRVEVRGRIEIKARADAGAMEFRGGGVAGLPLSIRDVIPVRDKGAVQWDRSGFRFHARLEPGLRLITLAWKDVVPPRPDGSTREVTHYMDWRWVDVRPPAPGRTVPEIVLTLEPAVSGEAEVALGPGLSAKRVAFTPADAEGKIPNWGDRRYGEAFEESVVDGKALFRRLRPGRYVFYPAYDPADPAPPAATACCEVVGGARATATLRP